ncbi:hypothetical protein C8R47DRAFT_1071998 [Mycena vitilis]|nr:hypothetical protein C8R47DRAFT_1071998 [Mycena vitilis]
MSLEDGFIGFRSSRVVDVSCGRDGKDLAGSRIAADRGLLISDDENLADALANWVPVYDDETELDPEVLAAMDSVSGASDNTGDKRKSYASSDNPGSLFPQVQQLFLEEGLRREGLGYHVHHQECALCGCKLDADAADDPVSRDHGDAADGPAPHDYGDAAEKPAPRIFRCDSWGEFLQCKNCCLERHSRSPLHVISEWKGRFWETTPLISIGFVYQLGHEGGSCKRPEAKIRTLVVMDVNIIHTIKYRFCGCDRSDTSNNLRQILRNAWYPGSTVDPDTCATFKSLDFFRLLNVIGNVNAQDFVRTLEHNTNAMGFGGLDKVADRYKTFMLMARQYAFLLRARRAGRAHDPDGLVATEEGECSVNCWLCPFDGRNLVAGWRNVESKYRLILAVDANFKLKNRIRANERDDPPLGPGWGAFVEPTRYREHLKKYVAENDVSSCIAFAALTQKETKNTTGLRVSGVGGCVCARHEVVRPNGLGDLQKGERYANIDYIVMSALAGFDLKELTISYDIACQWHKNLRERVTKLPEDLRKDFEAFLFQCGLPVWHASSHEAECTNRFSLSFLPGVGKTDGEGIERLWAELNAYAYHTRNMGVGHRADSLEDKIDYHNYMKNITQASTLRRKLIVAIAERARQVNAFKEVNKSIPVDVRRAWQERIDAFLADPTSPNPYLISAKDGPSEHEIRVTLKNEEEAAAAKGAAPLHGTSATAFLTAGLQLEDTQRRIKAQITGLTIVTADRESKIQEQRLALLAKLRPFRKLQAVYTPGAIVAMEDEERRRDPEALGKKAENISLFLPSALTADQRARGCQDGLVEMEARLREAQCYDALALLRARLHSKRHLLYWKGSNMEGQIGSTRLNSLIGQLGDRITAAAKKYREARSALLKLRGPDYAPHFKVLLDTDLTLDGDVKNDEDAARKKLSMLSAGKGERTPRHLKGSSRKVLSWIWASQGSGSGNGDGDKDGDGDGDGPHESLRVEWARAKARKNRWEEEVLLLREEMRRLLRYLDWIVATWETRATQTATRQGLEEGTRAGLEAYAWKQADRHRRLCQVYMKELSLSLNEALVAVAADEEDEEEGPLGTLFTQEFRTQDTVFIFQD